MAQCLSPYASNYNSLSENRCLLRKVQSESDLKRAENTALAPFQVGKPQCNSSTHEPQPEVPPKVSTANVVQAENTQQLLTLSTESLQTGFATPSGISHKGNVTEEPLFQSGNNDATQINLAPSVGNSENDEIQVVTTRNRGTSHIDSAIATASGNR
jgi:hypothetical protein